MEAGTMAQELRLAREKKRASSVSSDESQVMYLAVKVIGNRNEAMRWMGTPVRALEYATPVSLLGTRKGCQAVITVLKRLEHGVL
jgi:putative toxin-antitoxin system antitoxin component (TIGR02293 family)